MYALICASFAWVAAGTTACLGDLSVNYILFNIGPEAHQKNRRLLPRSHGKTKETFESRGYDLLNYGPRRGERQPLCVMRGRRFHRGLGAVAGVVVSLTAAVASLAAGLSISGTRYADPFELPVLISGETSGPHSMLRNPLEEVSGSFPLSDDLTLQSGFNVDVGRMLDRYAPTAFDGLFYSSAAYGSGYTGLSNGGNFLGLSADLSDGLGFTMGHASSSPGLNRYLMDARLAFAAMGGHLFYDYRDTDSLIAGMHWDFARWGGLSLTASRTAEHGLGLPSFTGARTTALGVSAHVGFGGGWVTTASYAEGLTQLELRPGAFTPDASLRTEAYGVAVAKHGLFSKNDALGVTLARPAPNFATFATPNKSNDLQFFGRDKILNMAPETDIELGYKTEFFGDAIALQANASYQMNYGGMTGNNAVSLLSKAKIKF